MLQFLIKWLSGRRAVWWTDEICKGSSWQTFWKSQVKQINGGWVSLGPWNLLTYIDCSVFFFFFISHWHLHCSCHYQPTYAVKSSFSAVQCTQNVQCTIMLSDLPSYSSSAFTTINLLFFKETDHVISQQQYVCSVVFAGVVRVIEYSWTEVLLTDTSQVPSIWLYHLICTFRL